MSFRSRKNLIKLSCLNVLLATSLPSLGEAEYLSSNSQIPSASASSDINFNSSTGSISSSNLSPSSNANASLNSSVNISSNLNISGTIQNNISSVNTSASPNISINGSTSSIPDTSSTSPNITIPIQTPSLTINAMNTIVTLSGTSSVNASKIQFGQTQKFNTILGHAISFYHGSNSSNTNLAQYGTIEYESGSDAILNTKSRIWGALSAGRSFDAGNKGQNQSSSGHDWSMMAGIDNDFKEDLMIGFSAGGGSSRFKTSSTGNAQQDSNGGQVAAYGMQRWGQAYLSGILNLALYNLDSQRIAAPVSTSLIKGNTISYGTSVQFEAGYRFDINKDQNITPFITFEPGLIHQNGYHETGSDAATAGSIFKSSINRHLSSSLGLETQNNFKVNESWSLESNIRAAFVHEFNPTSKQVIALQIAPTTSYIFSGSTHLENSARLSAGLQLNNKEGMSYFVKAITQLADRSQYYEGQLGLRYTW
jgi:hypothetical protein